MSNTRLALLGALGWNEFFEQQFNTLGREEWMPARIIGEEKNLFRLETAHEKTIWGEISGRFHFEATDRRTLPATGDWVACAISPGADRAVIHHRFERRSCLVRKVAGRRSDDQILAANIDTVFITTSLNEDLNLRRIERYLTLVWESGATPVILLTKADLATNVDAAKAEIESIAFGVDLYCVSAMEGTGIDQLKPFLVPTKTVVLVGSSGVGKSTLINHLLGKEILKTQAIGSEDKGRHTTTARYLLKLPEGGMLIDTPGMRELQLGDHGDGLTVLFEDIEALGQECKFSDCAHKSEPGCRVKGALESGELSQERVASYEKLQREVRFHRMKTDKAFASEERAKWRTIHKSLKALKKHKPGG